MTPRPTPGRRAARLRSSRATSIAAAVALVALTALGSGCTSWRQVELSQLAIKSEARGGPVVKGDFDTAVYGYDDQSTLTAVLIDGPVDDPRQAVTLRMFWKPAAGRTPISPKATNATVHYLVFSPAPRDPEDASVAIYSGAGYLFPRDDAGDASFSASLWEASVVLEDRSESFRDVLGPASISGRFTATHDEEKTLELLSRLSQRVSERLGYPRLIDGRDGSEATALARP